MLKVDGIWSNWSNWTECSETCDIGITLRNRTCYGPFYDGEPCPGLDVELKNCTIEPCAGAIPAILLIKFSYEMYFIVSLFIFNNTNIVMQC